MNANERASLAQDYTAKRSFYDEALRKIDALIQELTEPRRRSIQSITGRVKERESFLNKAQKAADDESSVLKYTAPFDEITDLVGFRIVTYFSDDATAVTDDVCSQFDIIERVNKGQQLGDDRFGYQSIHALLRIRSERAALVEWRKFKDLTFELQVRTILQHAWAEIEHDIRYKTDVEIRPPVRRRFAQLASLLEIADREFVSIREEDERLRSEAVRLREAGKSDEIALDGASLRQFFAEQHLTLDITAARDFNFAASAMNAVGVRTVADLSKLWADTKAAEIIEYMFKDASLTPMNIVVTLIAKEHGDKPISQHSFSYVQESAVFWEWAKAELENWKLGRPRSITYREYHADRKK